MSNESSNQPRFCTNCGIQIRPGAQFCVSCGASMVPNQTTAESSSMPAGPSASGSFGSTMYSIGRAFSNLKASFSTSSSDTSGNTWKGTLSRFLSWFRDIPVGAKFVFVGLISIPGLIILALLSPVMRVVAIVVFGMSILALVVRGVQRKSIREWGIVAVASLVLIPIFGGVSVIFYGSGFPLGGVANSEGSSEPIFAGSGDWESEEDYLYEVRDSYEKIRNIHVDYSNVFQNYTSGYISSQTTSEEMYTYRLEMYTHTSYFEGTVPPSGYNDFQEAMLSSWYAYEEVIQDSIGLAETGNAGELETHASDIKTHASDMVYYQQIAAEELPDNDILLSLNYYTNWEG